MTKESIPPWTEVPSHEHIYPYLLIALYKLGEEAKTTDVAAKLAKRFQLNEAPLKKTFLFYSNTTLAGQDLTAAGYLISDSPSDVWALSQKGKEKIPDLVKWDINKDEESLDNFREEVKIAAKTKKAKKAKQIVEESDKDMTKEPVPPWTEIPSEKYIYPYLLLALHELGGEAEKRDVVARLAEGFQLSKELLKRKTKRGEFHFSNKTAWARNDLKIAGYLTSDSPLGVWALSQKGKEKIPDLTEWATNKDKESLDNFREEVRLAANKKQAEKSKQVVEESDKDMTKEPVPPWTEIPSEKHIYPYLLLALHELGGEAKKPAVVARLAEIFQLSEKLLEERTKTGSFHFTNRTAWARESLKVAGYLASDSPVGVWALSQKGKEKIPELTEWDTNKDKESLDDFRKEVRPAAKKREVEESKQIVEEPDKEEEQEKEEPAPPLIEVPSRRHIYPYLLLALHELGGEAKKPAVVARLAEIFQLSEKLLEERTKTGSFHFTNNTAWARQDLKVAGYLASDSPIGIWALSQKGKEKIPELTKWDTNRDKESLDNFRNEVSPAAKKREAEKSKQIVEESDKKGEQGKKEPVPPWTEIPSRRHTYPYLLLALHELGGEAKTKDVVARLAKRFQLSEELLEKKTKSGEFHFHNKTAWARQDLKVAGYLASDSPVGVWALSQEGKEKISDLTKWTTNKDKESLDNFREEVRLAAKKKGARKAKQIVEEPDKEGKQGKKEPAPPLTEVPSSKHIYPYLLLELHELGGEAKTTDVVAGLAERFELSEELLKKKRKRGGSHFYFNTTSARHGIKEAGYLASDSPAGVWVLSQEGKEKIPDLTEWDINRDKESLDNFRKEIGLAIARERIEGRTPPTLALGEVRPATAKERKGQEKPSRLLKNLARRRNKPKKRNRKRKSS